jgi:hypothetical protein
MSSKTDMDLGTAPALRAGVRPLPCLFITTESLPSENVLPQPKVNLSAIAKKAETLFVNLDGLIRRVGIERVGFVTLTFREHITGRDEASKRFHKLAVAVLKPEDMEFISVPERQGSGRFHFHLATAFPCDIRTGFDFAACELANAAKRDGDRESFQKWQSVYFGSANGNLRKYWSLFRSDRVRKYGFGRCETLPVLSNAKGLARYVGAYVTTASRARLADDKGMRTVRYSLRQRTASVRWAWADGPGARWRRGMQIIGQILEITYEQFEEKFGKRWPWHLKETVTVLGKNYEEGLRYAALVPEWADYRSRLLYLARVSCQLAGVEKWLLPEIEYERDRDENETPF